MARVLIVVPHHEPLVESASRAASNVAADRLPASVRARAGLAASAADIGLDPRVRIDRSFSAVPIGTAEAGLVLESLEPSRSDNFVVRAEVPDEMVKEGYVNGQPIFNDPDIAPLLICGGDPAVGNAGDVAALHRIAPVHQRGATGDRVAIAIMDSGISASHLATLGLRNVVDQSVIWNALPAIAAAGRLTAPGAHPIGHGTMCAFDALIAAPDARLLDYPILHRARQPGGSIMAGALSDALQAYANLEAFWSIVYGPSRANYDSLVINNSWGVFHPSWDFPPNHPGRYIDNPNHPFNLRVEAMAREGIDVLFAAGNCGAQCPDPRCKGTVTQTITGANAHPAVLTLAGIGTNFDRVGYSSEGPPIPGMGAPQKPDLACATHFDGSQAYAPSPDSGTSAACPVAAGCVAALRSRQPQAMLPSHRLFDVLRSTASKPAGAPQGLWDPQIGFGVLDLDAAAAHLGI